jgi:soluble lytic murein transglycosylase-like protein
MTAVRAYETGQYAKALHLAQDALQVAAAKTPEALAAQSRTDAPPDDLARVQAPLTGDAAQAVADARLVEALALSRLGRLHEAADKFDALDDDGFDLGPGLVLYRLHVAQAIGRCDDAQALADTLPQTSTLGAQAWLIVAHCRVHAGDKQGAVIALKNIDKRTGPEGPVTEGQALGGQLAEAMSQPLQAAQIYRALLTSAPWSRAARSIAPRFARLRRRGIAIAPITPIDSLPIAAHQRDTMQYDAARITLHHIETQARHNRRNDWLNKAQMGLVELDIVDRNYAAGQSLLAAILRRKPTSDVRAQALFLQGDMLGRQGRIKQALDALAQAQMQGAGAPFAQLAALSAARLAFATAHLDVAEAHLNWLLNQAPVNFEVSLVRDDGVPLPVERDSIIDAAWWLRAWMLVQAHADPNQVQKALEHVRPTGDFADAALFWQARMAEDNHNFEGARALANALARRSPTSFYAMLSLHFLQQSKMCTASDARTRFAWAQLSTPFGPVSAERLRPKAPATDSLAAQYLFEHGLVSESRRMLRTLPTQALGDTDKIVTASLYRRLGQMSRAVNLTRHVVANRDAMEPALVELAFPRPYARLVQQAAAQYQVPAPLIYAIMREESSFNAAAKSPRQAYGLMQLIVPTAKRLARGAHVKRVKESTLLSPEVSIRLGAYYLAELLRHTHGNLVATVAAYQAGEGNVHRWLRGREMMQPEAFAEEIPYTSTRQYVRDVLSDYSIYSFMLAGEPPSPVQWNAQMMSQQKMCSLPFARVHPNS